MLRVFVYGTLKPGEVAEHLWAGQVEQVEPAIAIGQLYALPMGYPAMTPGAGWVQGFVLSFRSQALLDRLDDYEGHAPEIFAPDVPEAVLAENSYARQWQPLYAPDQRSLPAAWIYQMTERQIQRLQGIHLPDGHWTPAKQNAAFAGAPRPL